MDIRYERNLYADDQILYAEIACNYPNAEIPTECPCGAHWEKGSRVCQRCGFELKKGRDIWNYQAQ